ncbi:MAG TPA: DNA polymerase III subunit gamma/tau, partial [Coriobacteriia bacterium]|nr:DNA polymerase III subunit gamma/tau [Coriobacteriia bacterium]
MAHVSWYRKYRPQTFADVVGQPHIERTLSNAVAEGNVAHAYLFTGPRGTGKTTTARILAKALNCEQGPTSTPDDTCEQCRAIAEGTHPDVHELDAASRRGIDDVREQIIGRVNFAPSRGRWKVYIIDEVHMLTREAFNALLKTFEEPPVNTVFVLATTDPHKVPETIHSRCQRFDFHRISVEDIVGRLRTIADAEGVTVPDGALALIAKHSLGGMRDAIGTLEQLSSFGGGTVTLEDVEGLLGEVDAELLFQAAEIVIERNVAEAFRFVARLAEAGIDMSEFVKGFVRHVRDLFVLAAVGASGAVDTTSEDLGRLESQATRLGVDRAARLLEILGRLTTELRQAPDQRLAVEVALTRMARPQSDLTLESLAERMDALEAGTPLRDVVASVAPSAPRPAAPEPAAKATAVPATAEGAAPPVASVSAGSGGSVESAASSATAPGSDAAIEGSSASALDVATVKRAWPSVLAELKKVKASRSQLFNGTEAEVSGGTLIVEFPADQRFSMQLAGDSETLALLRRCVAAVIGVEPPVEFRLGRGGSSGAPAPEVPGDAGLPGEGGERAEPMPSEPTVETVEPAAVDAGEAGETEADLEARVIAELGAKVVD